MNSGSFMKKIIGLILFFVAIGMLLMMVIHNRLIGLIILAPVSYTHLTLPTKA